MGTVILSWYGFTRINKDTKSQLRACFVGAAEMVWLLCRVVSVNGMLALKIALISKCLHGCRVFSKVKALVHYCDGTWSWKTDVLCQPVACVHVYRHGPCTHSAWVRDDGKNMPKGSRPSTREYRKALQGQDEDANKVCAGGCDTWLHPLACCGMYKTAHLHC